jgi:hypothetical protein
MCGHSSAISSRDVGTSETQGHVPNNDDTVTYSVVQKQLVVRMQGCGRLGDQGLSSALYGTDLGRHQCEHWLGRLLS